MVVAGIDDYGEILAAQAPEPVGELCAADLARQRNDCAHCPLTTDPRIVADTASEREPAPGLSAIIRAGKPPRHLHRQPAFAGGEKDQDMPLRRFLFAVMAAFALSAHAAELRIGLAADVTSLDPHYLNVAPNNNAAWHVFDALVHVDADARLAPGLAVSWRAIDPTTWEFKLRKGVKFHNGADFTAEDGVFSLERPATLAASPGPFTGFVKPIVAKEVIDPWTLLFKTAAPYAMLPYDLNSIFIVSKKAASVGKISARPCGSFSIPACKA